MEKVIEINLKNDIKNIFNFKKVKYNNYRNFPNQNSIKYIHRFKPKYVRNYSFSNYNFEKEKMEVEKSKYALIAQREERFFNKKNLPEIYLKDEIILLPKNTNTVYAYWEITSKSYESIIEKNIIEDKNPKIILSKINGEEVFSIDVYSNIGNIYINNIKSNDDYIAKIGFVDKFNNFIEIAHSKEVNVPNHLPSENFDITWGYANAIYIDNNRIIDFKTIDKHNYEKFLKYTKEIFENDYINDLDNNRYLENENNFIGSSNRHFSSDKLIKTK